MRGETVQTPLNHFYVNVDIFSAYISYQNINEKQVSTLKTISTQFTFKQRHGRLLNIFRLRKSYKVYGKIKRLK